MTQGIGRIGYVEYVAWIGSQGDGEEPPNSTPPGLQAAVVEHSAPTDIVLSYDDLLDETSVPSTSDFAVSGGKTVSSVEIVGSTVTLTVNSAYANGNVITVSYTPGVNKLRDSSGDNAIALSNRAVVNNIADTTAPSLITATVEHAQPTKVVLTYGEALDTNSVPATGDYSVSGGKTVSSVAVVGSTVTITVNSAYANGSMITVSYTPGTNPVRDLAGNSVAGLSNQSVVNNIADTTAPVLSTATVENAQPTKIVLTYGEALDAGSVPATGDFAPSGGKTVSSVAVVGSVVTVTVNSAYANGNVITVSYTPGVNPIRDAAGNNVSALSARSVVNNIADTTAPVLATATVEAAQPTKIVLTYGEALDTGSVPATGDFVPSGGKTVSSVAVVGATVTVTVNTAYVNGNVITVSYTPGSNPIRDAVGNNSAALTAQAVVNNIPDTTAPTFSSAVVQQALPTKIVLTYSEALDTGSIPSIADFAPSGGRVATNVAISGSTCTVTVNAAYSKNSVITLSYTPGATNKLRDVAGNNAASLSAQSVTNNVTGAIPVTMIVLDKMTNEGNEVYAATSAGTSNTAQGLIVEASAAGVDAWIECQRPVTGGGDVSTLLCFDPVRTLQTLNMDDFIAHLTSTGAINQAVNSSTTTSIGYTLAEGSGNRMRLRRTAANAMVIETTTDDGANWTNRHTFAATPTVTLRPHIRTTYSTFARKVYQPRHAGLRFDLLGSKFMADGNSQTEGVNGAGNSFPGQLATALAVTVTNFGVGGQNTTDMASDAATQIDAILQTGMNILIAGEIRNHLVAMAGSANARTALDAFWAYCDARRAAATATKQLRIVVWNILPCGHTSSPIGNTALNALFDDVNTLMAAEWRLHVNALVDVRSNANLTDPFNTTYFTDDVHLTTAGDTVLKGLVQTALEALA